MINAIRIIIFSGALFFLGLAIALPDIDKIFTIHIANVPNQELMLLQFSLFGAFVGLMLMVVFLDE